MLQVLERFFANRGKRGGRSDRIRIDAQLDERGLARLRRALERRREILGALHGLAVAAEGARIGREVRVLELGAVHPPRIFAFLVHADRAVQAVVHHHGDEVGAVLHGRRDLLPGHQVVAVATEREHRALRFRELGGDRRRIAIAHRAVGRAELRAKALVAEMPVQPAGEVAGAAGHDRVLRQVLREPADDLAVLHASRHRARLGPFEELFPRRPGALLPGSALERKVLERFDELRISGIDRQRRPVYAAKLFGARVDVDQCLFRHRRLDQRVATGGHLAQPRADHEQHVGFLHALGELRVDADADVADVIRAAVVEEILAAERGADAEAVRLDPALQPRAGFARPAAAAEQHEWTLRVLQKLT